MSQVFGETKWQSLSTAITGSATALTKFLSIAAGIAVVAGAFALIDHLNVSFEEAKEKAEETNQAYDEQKDKVESLNKELEMSNSRIAELETKGALTLVEADELQRLRDTNDELSKQVDFEQRLLKIRGEESAAAARDVLTSGDMVYYRETGKLADASIWEMIKGGVTKLFNGGDATAQANLIGGIDASITKLEELKAERDELNSERLELDPEIDIDEIDRYNDRIKDLDSQITSLTSNVSANMEDMRTYQSSLIEGTDDDLIEYCDNLSDRFMEVTGAASEVPASIAEMQEKIDGVLSQASLTEPINALKQLAQEKNGLNDTDLGDFLNDFPLMAKEIGKACGLSEDELAELKEQFDGDLGTGLVSAMKSGTNEAQTIFGGFIDTVNSMAGAIDFEAVKQQLLEIYGDVTPNGTSRDWDEFNEFQAMLDDLSEEKIKILVSMGYSIQSLTPDEILKELDSIDNLTPDLDLGLETQAEQVTKLKSSITSLQSAINSQSDLGTLSFDVYGADGMEDFASALEQVNDGYQYNIAAVNEIVKAKAEERKAYLEVGKAQAQSKYLENAREIRNLTKNYDTLTAAQKDHLASLQAEQDSAYANIRGFDVLASEIDNATSAYQTWLNAQSAADSGKMFEDVQTAIERMDNVLNNTESDLWGKLGDDGFQADLNLVLPDKVDKKDEDAIRSYLDDLKNLLVFNEDGTIMDLRFDKVLEPLREAGILEGEVNDLHIAQGKTLEDIEDTLNISESVAQSFVDYLNDFILDPDKKITWTNDLEKSLGDVLVEAEHSAEQLQKMDEYSDLSVTMDVSDIEDADAAAAELDRSLETLKEMRAAPDIDDTAAKHLDNMIRGIVAQKQMLEAPVVMTINTNALTGNVRTIMETLQEFQQAKWNLEQLVEINADTTDAEDKVNELIADLQSLDYTDVPVQLDFSEASDPAEIQKKLDELNDGRGFEVLAEIIPDYAFLESAEAAEQAMLEILVDDENYQKFKAELEADELDKDIVFGEIHTAVTRYIANLKDVHKNIVWHNKVEGATPSASTTHVDRNNDGSKVGGGAFPATLQGTGSTTLVRGNAMSTGDHWGTTRTGKYLLGELGPELCVDTRTGQWYTVGDNGAQFVTLPKGTIVFNHEQTEELLRSGNTSGRAIAISNARALVGGTKLKSKKPLTGGSLDLNALMGRIEGGYSSPSSSYSSSSSKPGSSSSSSSEEDNWFERQYAYHNHLINMEQESVEDYLKWLDEAYQKAYDEGIIDLNDFYQYQEEVFEKLRELYEDSLNDMEHSISMLEHYQGTAPEIVGYYQSMMASIEKEIAAARAAGLTDNDAYIQGLQDRWWQYHDAVADIEETTINDAEDSLDELVRFRMDMLKQDYESEKDSLNDRLDNLKDFYDEQKKMLDDQEEKEDYLKEQREKRKAVSDIENELARLEMDDSAWAQKRKLELNEELLDAQEDLNEFEHDRALQLTKDQLDAQYELQANSINAELEALENKLTSERALYDQALEDIRNDNGTLLQEMIDWNAQYGSFIDRDVTQMWNAASDALTNYHSLYDDWYMGVQLQSQNAQSTTPASVTPSAGSSWAKNPISGEWYEQNKPKTPTSGSGSSSGGGGSGGSGGGSGGGDSGSANRPYGYIQDYSGTIYYGQTGNRVKALQNALNKLGYGNSGTTGLDGIFGVNTRAAVYKFQGDNGLEVDGRVGPKTKAKFKSKGYAVGTPSAVPGIHQLDELGPEYLFTSADGNNYRVFSGGEKVLNAKATDFLYKFANSGGGVIADMMSNLINTASVENAAAGENIGSIRLGDIIINGNADEKTVSEIRRAQKDEVNFILKQFGRLKQK